MTSAAARNARRRRPREATLSRAPDNWPELLERLRACRRGRSGSVARVAAYALEQPLEIAFGTTTHIAEACGVSGPAVVLFAQRLGFAGFIALREFYRGPLRPAPIPAKST